MKNKFEKLFKEYEKLLASSEKEIIKGYTLALKAMYELTSEMYRKYETDGKLTFQEMAKYNRLDKFNYELGLIVEDVYKVNTRQIRRTLEDTYKLNYLGVKEIVETTKNRRIIPIMKDEVIQRAMYNNISGLKWTERMGLHRDTAVLKIRETVTRGLREGQSYSVMAKGLNESLSGQMVNPRRIVRTESHRVFSEAKKDSLDSASKKVKMTKTWITARDERVRSTHNPMDGVVVPYEENFILPDGATGFGPGMIGDPEHDIHCRCDWIIDFVD